MFQDYAKQKKKKKRKILFCSEDFDSINAFTETLHTDQCFPSVLMIKRSPFITDIRIDTANKVVFCKHETREKGMSM